MYNEARVIKASKIYQQITLMVARFSSSSSSQITVLMGAAALHATEKTCGK